MYNSFVNAVANQEARTENNMKARKSSADPVTDLFFKIGASRGKNIIPDFTAALVADENLAIRVALWARDVRGGAGERKLFRDILVYLENSNPELAEKILPKVPELGRFDDLLVFTSRNLKEKAFNLILHALKVNNGLCAKWMPRKGQVAVELRSYLGLSPKAYRKMLVDLTKVVEQQMCANEWDDINFSHVPSLASSRYKKAFNRHTPKFAEYVAALVRGDEGVKVNANAVYPYDILKGVISLSYSIPWNKTEQDHIIKQWEALPNFVGDANILPMVDVSGSMSCPADGKSGNVSCMDVAVSLGLYLADKNSGAFKDTFLTFSGEPELVTLKGNVIQKAQQMLKSKWQMNTNLHSAFDKILSVAKSGNVPQEDMPDMVLILSDMQFDQCARYDDSAIQMIRRKYEEAGYEVPNVVFWNINAHSNIPVKYTENKTCLVSGFSPAIVKSILSANMEDFTPRAIMLQTIMQERYDF